MIKWIARWFHRTVAAPPAGAGTAAHPVHPDHPDHPGSVASIAPAPDAGAIHTVFYRWLAGGPGADVPPATEQLILDELRRLLASPQSAADLVPRVPAVLPRLLRSLRDNKVCSAELARQFGQDVVLVGALIREANSSAHRLDAPVKTIEAALMLLGQSGVRMLLAKAAFRPIIRHQAGRFAQQLAPRLWQQSEACALAASRLAPAEQADPFEAYLAALLHNVGLVVALRLIDQLFAGDTLPRSEPFCRALLASAQALSSQIAALWEFPATVSQAIAQAGQSGASPLAQVLALADRLAALRMLIDAGQIAADDQFALRGLDAAALACLEQLRTEDPDGVSD
ncbi:MAG: HDOD domain-containing protein [Massilia sp.]|nr:HDOD domain-containing protein [Massilia sp.]